MEFGIRQPAPQSRSGPRYGGPTDNHGSPVSLKTMGRAFAISICPRFFNLFSPSGAAEPVWDCPLFNALLQPTVERWCALLIRKQRPTYGRSSLIPPPP